MALNDGPIKKLFGTYFLTHICFMSNTQDHPIQVMVHLQEAGEVCPVSQLKKKGIAIILLINTASK